MKAKMGLKRKFNNYIYYLVVVSRDKNIIETYARNQRKAGKFVRITKDKWDDARTSTEYTAWQRKD